jgi:hypothetical protein
VKSQKQLAARFAAVSAAALFIAVSAFGESRPSNETRSRIRERATTRSDRSARTEVRRDESRSGRVESRRRAISRGESDRRGRVDRDDSDRRSRVERRSDDRRDHTRADTRNYDRDRGEWNDRDDRGREGRQGDRWRGDSRSRSSQRGYYGGSHYGGRQHYSTRGRISRVHRYGSGYRVWVIGAPYPFFVPLSHYHRDRFRIGLTIGIGGFYNPLGYYDYYDGYYNDRSYARGELSGVVESVDYRGGTFVVRNDATGSFVTVVSRDRRHDVRAGDYVELYGDWTRGVFRAYDVDIIDGYYRR